MNRIDLQKYSQFPMSVETLAFIQDMVTLAAKLSSIGGSLYILDGCEDNGTTVSAGTVVINGEVLPFAGGAKASYVIVQETKSSVQVYGDTYSDVYMNRTAIFGSGAGQIPWASFVRLPNLAAMATSLASLSDALANHTNNHSVAWSSVSGKPADYPPAAHSHAWDSVSGKPTAFPPSAHNHAGRAVYLGIFDYDGTPYKQAGELPLVDVTKIGTGRYKISHNLGHTAYTVSGVSFDTQLVSIVALPVVEANHCEVIVADDASANNASCWFTITSFA